MTAALAHDLEARLDRALAAAAKAEAKARRELARARRLLTKA